MNTFEKYFLDPNADVKPFSYAAGTALGDMVGITADETVGRATDGALIFGKVAVLSEGAGKCSVQTDGWFWSYYSGADNTVAVGTAQRLVLDGAGKVKAPGATAAATLCNVVHKDATNNVLVFKIVGYAEATA